MSKILEDCLDQVFTGQETVDSILARYPEYENKLRPELEAALWLHQQRRIAEMRPGYLKPSRQRLMDQIKGKERNAVIGKKPILAWGQSVFGLVSIALLLVVTILVYRLGTNAVNASLAGDRLYDIKLAGEDLQISIASDPIDEASIYIELADKRANDVESLLLQGRYKDAEVGLNDYRQNILIATDLINNFQDNPTRKVLLAQKLGDAITIHNERFSNFVNSGGIPSNLVTVLSSTVALNDEITFAMVVVMEEFDEVFFPLQASAVPTTSFTSAPSLTNPASTLVLEISNPPILEETPELSATQEPPYPPAPTDKLIIPDPAEEDEDDGDLKPTKKIKTPKPTKTEKLTKTEKPTKTEKVKDNKGDEAPGRDKTDKDK